MEQIRPIDTIVKSVSVLWFLSLSFTAVLEAVSVDEGRVGNEDVDIEIVAGLSSTLFPVLDCSGFLIIVVEE